MFLIAIAVNSRINAFYTALGSILPIVVAVLSGMDHAILNAGLIGYNGVLCAIALGDKTYVPEYGVYVPPYIHFITMAGYALGNYNPDCPFCHFRMDNIILKRSLEKTV